MCFSYAEIPVCVTGRKQVLSWGLSLDSSLFLLAYVTHAIVFAAAENRSTAAPVGLSLQACPSRLTAACGRYSEAQIKQPAYTVV